MAGFGAGFALSGNFGVVSLFQIQNLMSYSCLATLISYKVIEITIFAILGFEATFGGI